MGGLWYALWITQDYRKRRRYWDLTCDLSDDELRALFAAAMVRLATYRQSRLPKSVPLREARAALILATLLREHAFHRAGQPGPRFLRSRRVVLRHAARLDVSGLI